MGVKKEQLDGAKALRDLKADHARVKKEQLDGAKAHEKEPSYTAVQVTLAVVISSTFSKVIGTFCASLHRAFAVLIGCGHRLPRHELAMWWMKIGVTAIAMTLGYIFRSVFSDQALGQCVQFLSGTK